MNFMQRQRPALIGFLLQDRKHMDQSGLTDDNLSPNGVF